MKDKYQGFLKSHHTLRVYKSGSLLFASEQDGLIPLLQYSKKFPRQEIVVFDRIMGNAAALLAARMDCREVYSPLGSELAITTLKRHSIKYNLDKVVPFIQRADGNGMCPMEKLSLGKEPEEFYEAVTRVITLHYPLTATH